MRISYWSSDVCSSDLVLGCVLRLSLAFGGSHLVQFFFVPGLIHGFRSAFQLAFFRITPLGRHRGSGGFLLPLSFCRPGRVPSLGTDDCTKHLCTCSGKLLRGGGTSDYFGGQKSVR